MKSEDETIEKIINQYMELCRFNNEYPSFFNEEDVQDEELNISELEMVNAAGSDSAFHELMNKINDHSNTDKNK